MSNPGKWRVVTAALSELEGRLNDIEQDGYRVVSVHPVGAPEALSNIPRDQKTLEQRTTFAVIAHREAS